MSTYLYLECLDHDPVISSYWLGEVGQHLSDLPDIQGYIAKRDELVHLYGMDNITVESSWARTAMYFFSQHPKCRIGIRDEYGHAHPTIPGALAISLPADADPGRCGKCRRPRDNHRSHDTLCPICLYEENPASKEVSQ